MSLLKGRFLAKSLLDTKETIEKVIYLLGTIIVMYFAQLTYQFTEIFLIFIRSNSIYPSLQTSKKLKQKARSSSADFEFYYIIWIILVVLSRT